MTQASASVWATHGGVRVDPETGRYIEARTDIHADYPSGDYQGGNAVWDGAGCVRLKAARNEFAAFQVIVEAPEPVAGVRVRLDSVAGPGGAEISGRNVALFKAWYVKVGQASTGYDRISLGPAWYPDALIPVPTGEPAVFDVPDPRNAIGPSQKNQSLWVDIYVPRDAADAPPGTYVGELTVSAGGSDRTIRLELDVWDFALPDEFHCRGDVWNESIARMPEEQEMAYYQLCHQHRFCPGVPRYRPGLAIEGKEVKLDWTEYDRRLMKYFDGSAFTAARGYWGPGEGVPLDHILMPFDCEKLPFEKREWPVATPPGGPDETYEALWVDAARKVKEHFDANPTWSKVEKIVFIDGLDESYYESAYDRMRYFAELLWRGTGKGWFRYRVDGGYSDEAMEGLCGHVDLWICHTAGYDHRKIARFRDRGVEPWFYGPMIYERAANSACGSNTFIDLDLLTCRGIGWCAWKYRSGYCEWEFDWSEEEAWTQALNYRHEGNAYNGSGQFIYRGSFIGSTDPVPSIRLKAHRQGFQEYEYFWLLRQAGRGAEADRLVNAVVHAMPFGHEAVGNIEIWKNDPEAWDAARIEAGEMLSGGGA